MVYKKKSWAEKLKNNKNFPKILKFDPKFPCGRALEKMGAKKGDSVVLAPPLQVSKIMEKVPKGKLISLNEICKKLAKKHKVDYCCTLTTGIFVMIAANAAEETKSGLPYWRTIKSSGQLNEKYPGGAKAQKRLLEKEGYKIVKKGKKYFVENYEKFLVKV